MTGSKPYKTKKEDPQVNIEDENPVPAEVVASAEADEEHDDNAIDGDGVLNLFIHFAEQGISTPITIYTGGMAIAGILVSQKAFFELNLDLVKGKNRGLEIIFEGLINAAKDPADVDGNAPAPSYRYVHLRKAQIMTSGVPGIPSEGGLMRFSRTDVAGWTIGQLEAG